MSLTIAQFAGGASENFVKSLSIFLPNAQPFAYRFTAEGSGRGGRNVGHLAEASRGLQERPLTCSRHRYLVVGP
jgi:hypothetical protein